MPVINLPRDDRWGQIGQGLGKLIGEVAQGAREAQVSQGVAQIMQDPEIKPKDRAWRVMKDFGELGYKKYQDMIKSQVLQTEMDKTFAEIGKITVDKKLKEQQLPLEQRRILAGIEGIEQDTTASKALLPGRVGLQGAQIENTQASAAQTREQTATEVQMRDPRVAALAGDVGLKRESIDAKRYENAATRQALGEQGVAVPPTVGRSAEVAEVQPQITPQATPEGTSSMIEQQLKSFGLTPDETRQAAAMYRANERKKRGTGLDAALDFAKGRVEAREKREKPTPLPEGSAKVARSAAEYGAVLEDFAKELVGAPEKVGLLSGAGIKARAERLGLPIGDTATLNMLERQKQLVGAQAKQGAVFMSGQTIRLARDVTPNVDRSPLSNWLAIDAVADAQIATLQNERRRYADPNDPAKVTPVLTSAIDDALGYWQRIKQMSGSLQTHIATDERGKNERTVTYFMGNQVNPLDMKPLVKQDDTQYEVRGKDGAKTKITGTDLFNIARQLRKDPWQVYQEMR